jgi:hypothetical protein
VITVRIEPWGRKARSITDIRNTALQKKKKEWQYAFRLSGMNSLMEEAM